VSRPLARLDTSSTGARIRLTLVRDGRRVIVEAVLATGA
jgi:hypothetical protein